MTTNKQGYSIPSIFQMVKSIKHDEPKMLLVHECEFERINKIVNSGRTLTQPYKDFLEMIYIKYILNQTVKQVVKIQPVQHIGMRMLIQ